MSNAQDLQQIEVDIDKAKQFIANKDALIRLQSNSDFNSLINDGYFVHEASRLVTLKADPEMETEARQKDLDRMILGVAYFKRYLHMVMQMGFQMEKTLKADQETHEELLGEDIA